MIARSMRVARLSEAKSGMIVRYRRTALGKRAPAFTASFIEDRHVVEVPSHLGVVSGEAAVHAARTRLRPILMTSLSFILGVAPLAVATGAGAEMRQSLGTAVLFGMLGVTCFGLLFTPAFYTFIRNLGRKEHGGGLPEVSAYPSATI